MADEQNLTIAGTAVAAAIVAAVAAGVVHRAAPPPSAETGRGSEGIFGDGLQPRELRPREKPMRWTGPRAVFRFRHLPRGPAALEVGIHGHRGPVVVAAGGAVVGTVAEGETGGRFLLPGIGRSLDVELRPQVVLAASGRRLGLLLDHVRVVPEGRGAPPAGLVASFLGPALVAVLAATAVGLAPFPAGAIGAAVALVQALLLWPCGLARSPYAVTLALDLGVGAVVAGLFGAWVRRRWPGAGPWGFVAVLSAILVQWVCATSPLMVVSDVVFHANKLVQVARGDWFPTSVTQHAVPFRIPYGVSFYALLVPLLRSGLDPVDLVRAGAAASGVAASAALFLLLVPTGAARAGLAVLVLQLLPGVFDVYSYGNLSNVFGQAATVGLFAWWAGRAPGGFAVGGALVALAALAHLSSFLVLGVLCAALLAGRWREVRRDRVRLAALFLGFGLAALYYLQFWDVVAEQLPRLLEGGGQGRGASRTAVDALKLQVLGALGQWGIPAVALAALGIPRASRSALHRDFAAFWWAGAVLFLPAVVSPLDVRYLYALTVPVAVAATDGLRRTSARRSYGPWLAGGLLTWQAVVASQGVVEALLIRYR